MSKRLFQTREELFRALTEMAPEFYQDDLSPRVSCFFWNPKGTSNFSVCLRDGETKPSIEWRDDGGIGFCSLEEAEKRQDERRRLLDAARLIDRTLKDWELSDHASTEHTPESEDSEGSPRR